MKLKLFVLATAALPLLLCTVTFGQTYAITNARIVTVSGVPVERGTVVIRNGLIESVGPTVAAPADAKVIDGSGLTVYPGFIDGLTTLGLQAATQPTTGAGGGGGGTAARQSQAQSQPSTSNYPAGLRPEDTAYESLSANESQFETNRNAGFTTVVTVGRTGIFNGQSAVIDLSGDSVSEMVVKSPFAEHVSFVTVGGGQYPASLLGTFSALRQMLLDARRLKELQKMYAATPRGMKRPETDRSLEALIPVLDRQLPVVFNANREIEIIRALDLAKEFDLRAIIAGGQEAWKVADRLKAQNVPVLLSLDFPKRTAAGSPEADPDSIETLRFRAETPKGPARLAQAGVKFGFFSGSLRSINDFFNNAGKSIEMGLAREAAIRAMTLGTAEILGLDDRLGSIEPGKIANLAVVKGDLFGKDRFVSQVFVDGKLFEPKEPPKMPTTGGRGTSPSSALPNVGGNYTITIDVPGQPMQATFALTQQGALLTGSIQSQLGTAPIRDGKVTSEGFSFAATVDYAGSSIEILVRGTVSGNQISGTIDSAQGPVTFSGTRNP